MSAAISGKNYNDNPSDGFDDRVVVAFEDPFEDEDQEQDKEQDKEQNQDEEHANANCTRIRRFVGVASVAARRTTNRFHTDSYTLRFRSFCSQSCGDVKVSALIGLVVAGLAGTLVADVFGMFYVDCFLRAYRLPLRVFGIGSAVFAFVNTANDVAGAYFVDWYAAASNNDINNGNSNNSNNGNRRRDRLVGLSGCLLALSFLGPFFRWDRSTTTNTSSNVWDGLHFVGSLSVYDTAFSFNCILQGSIVSDNHSMTKHQRIAFFVCKDLVGILAPLVVTKIGLSLFDANNLRPFRVYAVLLAMVSSVLALVGQGFIDSSSDSGSSDNDNDNDTSARNKNRNTKVGATIYSRIGNNNDGTGDDIGTTVGDGDTFAGESAMVASNHGSNINSSSNSNSSNGVDLDFHNTNDDDNDDDYQDGVDFRFAPPNTNANNGSTLRFWQVVRDFVAHPNFRYWIAMEMLTEMQNTFMGNFQKTFVDRLLFRGEFDDEAAGWSREACDWMLALLDPSTQIVGLLLFLPVQRYGYARMYTVVFCSNIAFAFTLLLWNGVNNDHYNNNSTSTTGPVWPVAVFLFCSSVLSNAMAGTGFGLAMCDMVLEMKHSHVIVQGRTNAPSLAGLFMGVNALFCKPAESVLPILTAFFLGDGYGFGGNEDGNDTGASAVAADADAKIILYRLLVVPPLVCSILQLVVWSRYSLVPERTEQLREEMEDFEKNRNRRPRQQQQERCKQHEHEHQGTNTKNIGEFSRYRDEGSVAINNGNVDVNVNVNGKGSASKSEDGIHHIEMKNLAASTTH